MSGKNRSGLALAELTLSLGIGAVLLTSVWPQPQGDPIVRNERAAIESLRKIATAQLQLAASGAIDTDEDGVGEFGYLGELAGTAMLRVYNPACDCPGLTANSPRLKPPLLPPDFGIIRLDWRGETYLERDGYYFKMFLPDVQIVRDVEGIAEDGPHGVGGSSGALLPSPHTGKTFWCCYAWPVEDQVTGQRVFFVNQEGRILQTRNGGSPGGLVYEGIRSTPEFDAAYSDQPATPNGLTGMGAPLGNAPRQASDGNRWTPIRRL